MPPFMLVRQLSSDLAPNRYYLSHDEAKAAIVALGPEWSPMPECSGYLVLTYGTADGGMFSLYGPVEELSSQNAISGAFDLFAIFA